MLLVCDLLGWPALHPAIPINMENASATFTPELAKRLCTVLSSYMNYKTHLAMATAAKSSATSRKVSCFCRSDLYLIGMALGDCDIHAEALDKQAVRNIV